MLWCLLKHCVKCKDKNIIACYNTGGVGKFHQPEFLVFQQWSQNQTQYLLLFLQGLSIHCSVILYYVVDPSSFSNLLLRGYSLFLVSILNSSHAMQRPIQKLLPWFLNFISHVTSIKTTHWLYLQNTSWIWPPLTVTISSPHLPTAIVKAVSVFCLHYWMF